MQIGLPTNLLARIRDQAAGLDSDGSDRNCPSRLRWEGVEGRPGLDSLVLGTFVPLAAATPGSPD